MGGEYDPQTHRYDHHQRTFSNTFPQRPTKLSSAGLVYMHFGKPIIAARTSLAEDSPEVALLYEKLYAEFIEAIDANDNGIPAYDAKEIAAAALSKRFSDGGVTLASQVADMNSEWVEDPSIGKPIVGTSPDAEDARFLQASSLMGVTFLRKLNHYHQRWLPARAEVEKAYAARFEVDGSGAIMVLEGGGVPWKDHLYTFEAEAGEGKPKVLYVLYPEGKEEGAKWRVQCASVNKDSFESRRPLREEWRGVRDQELAAKSGIPGCVFVHASGFIGGNATKEGALEMARRSMA